MSFEVGASFSGNGGCLKQWDVYDKNELAKDVHVSWESVKHFISVYRFRDYGILIV